MKKIEQDNNEIHNVIKNRHSVRMYDPNFKITNKEIKEMLEEATLAPSADNLQSWRFLVLTDQVLKEKLHLVAFSQKPILDASAVIVLLGDLEAYRNIEKIYDIAIEKGIVNEEVKERLVDGVLSRYPNYSEQRRREMAILDGGLVAMQFMLIAKARGYSTLPMGGFSSKKLVEAFEIPERYSPIMLIAMGKEAQPAFETVRLSNEDVTFWNGMK
ncbi:MAG: nitroreductase family protein [Bacillales bacterium]|jgi:nitroreductase|nr:nitroreductase family protein [Bacillales bacterium]